MEDSHLFLSSLLCYPLAKRALYRESLDRESLDIESLDKERISLESAERPRYLVIRFDLTRN